MRWYSPFDWIPGPETEEEIEELRGLKRDKEKENKESSTCVTSEFRKRIQNSRGRHM